MVKHFSSTSSNRKNYNAMIAKNLCLPTNELEQDHNGTRIVAACKLTKSALRVKRGIKEFCGEFKVRCFFTEDDWKTVMKFEGTLPETSRSNAICQNEDKLNSAWGPVMKKALHDSLSRDTMTLTGVELWSSH